jgi:hypothetical protein
MRILLISSGENLFNRIALAVDRWDGGITIIASFAFFASMIAHPVCSPSAHP